MPGRRAGESIGQRRQQTTSSSHAGEALADKANKQRWAATRDKALADEANKRHHHESAECATTLAT
jgi:hypothetical protein